MGTAMLLGFNVGIRINHTLINFAISGQTAGQVLWQDVYLSLSHTIYSVFISPSQVLVS
jgi:hypothetical protein